MAETDTAVAQHIKPFWSQELVQHGRERLFPGGHGGKDYQNLELLGRLRRRHSVALIRCWTAHENSFVPKVVGSIPTAPTSLLILYKGLAKSARQQKAAIRAKSVGQWQMRLAVRMASRRINPCTRATCPQLFAESCGEFLGWHFWRRRRCHTCNRSEGRF